MPRERRFLLPLALLLLFLIFSLPTLLRLGHIGSPSAADVASFSMKKSKPTLSNRLTFDHGVFRIKFTNVIYEKNALERPEASNLPFNPQVCDMSLRDRFPVVAKVRRRSRHASSLNKTQQQSGEATPTPAATTNVVLESILHSFELDGLAMTVSWNGFNDTFLRLNHSATWSSADLRSRELFLASCVRRFTLKDGRPSNISQIIPFVGISSMQTPIMYNHLRYLLRSLDHPCVEHTVLVINNPVTPGHVLADHAQPWTRGEVALLIARLLRVSRRVTLFIGEGDRYDSAASSWNRMIEVFLRETKMGNVLHPQPWGMILASDIFFPRRCLEGIAEIMNARLNYQFNESVSFAPVDLSQPSFYVPALSPGAGQWNVFIAPMVTFRTLGYFDENLFPAYLEDFDMQKRLRYIPLLNQSSNKQLPFAHRTGVCHAEISSTARLSNGVSKRLHCVASWFTRVYFERKWSGVGRTGPFGKGVFADHFYRRRSEIPIDWNMRRQLYETIHLRPFDFAEEQRLLASNQTGERCIDDYTHRHIRHCPLPKRKNHVIMADLCMKWKPHEAMAAQREIDALKLNVSQMVERYWPRNGSFFV